MLGRARKWFEDGQGIRILLQRLVWSELEVLGYRLDRRHGAHHNVLKFKSPPARAPRSNLAKASLLQTNLSAGTSPSFFFSFCHSFCQLIFAIGIIIGDSKGSFPFHFQNLKRRGQGRKLFYHRSGGPTKTLDEKISGGRRYIRS